ncbi:MAG: Rpn family recombination-promoting nuclease/putative transposase, partial [Bdellovibrionaceae bacterium]|nr:Rpn family recombination-promoting nuclease/putative transposase [Pseudobdellovibrionaceae bacterium]
TFSNLKRARKLVEFVLSKKELGVYDIKKLRIEKESFKESRKADLILSIPFKKSAKIRARIFILCEHKSHYDKGLFCQVLDYIILLRNWLIKQAGHAELIIPVLFYHGRKAMKWKGSLLEDDFKGFFNKIPIETKKDMLNFNLRIINTKDLKVRNWFKKKAKECWGFIRLLDEIWDIKNPDKEKVRRIIKDYFGSELKGATKEKEKELAISVISYLQSAGGLRKAVWKSAEKLLIKDNIMRGGTYMGAIERIREEGMQKGIEKGMRQGRQEGLEKGMQQGRQEIILNLLKEKADISFISKVTGMPEKKIKKLKNGA